MAIRISSLPPRDQLFQTRDLVSSPPPGAPGTGPVPTKTEDGATIVDLTPEAAAAAANLAAVAAANAAAASAPKSAVHDAARLMAGIQRASVTDPNRLMRAQGAPDASRALTLLIGD